MTTAKREVGRLTGLCHEYEARLGLVKNENLRLSGVIIGNEQTITHLSEVQGKNEVLNSQLNVAKS